MPPNTHFQPKFRSWSSRFYFLLNFQLQHLIWMLSFDMLQNIAGRCECSS